MIREVVTRLPVPPSAMLSIGDMPRTVTAHDAHAAMIPALHLIECGGLAHENPLAFPIRVAAWNLERCLFPEASAQALAGVDIVLLSEMDNGMARTAQRHGTAEIASALGMSYAYAVEFLELGLGSPIERDFCHDTHNDRGFHGNALLARGSLTQPFAMRLFGHRQWFSDPEQPRLGERVAVGGVVATEAGPLLAISTHLESACAAAHREAQMAGLIELIDKAYPNLPVLIGGDLNTGNHAAGDWRAEGLFELARAAGFTIHGGPEDGPTTRPSLFTRFPERAMKLDWFLARGLTLGKTTICPALTPEGTPLSDHDRIETTILGFSAVTK